MSVSVTQRIVTKPLRSTLTRGLPGVRSQDPIPSVGMPPLALAIVGDSACVGYSLHPPLAKSPSR
jgi:hypothetical protein